MRPLKKEDHEPLRDPLARVEERLRRDAAEACADPRPELALRIARALQSSPKQVVERPSMNLSSRATAALAVLFLAALALPLAWRPGARAPQPSEPIAAAQPVPFRPLALKDRFAELFAVSGPNLFIAVDEPLLAEARLLVNDGERVARALVERVPAPLRRGLAPRAE